MKLIIALFFIIMFAGCAYLEQLVNSHPQQEEQPVVVQPAQTAEPAAQPDPAEPADFGYVHEDIKSALAAAERNNALMLAVICPPGCTHCYHVKVWALCKNAMYEYSKSHRIVLCHYVKEPYCSDFYRKYAGNYQSFLGSGITPYIALGTAVDGEFVPLQKNGKWCAVSISECPTVFGYKVPIESKDTWTPGMLIDIIEEFKKGE